MHCDDIGQYASGRRSLEPGTAAWEQALGGVPRLLIVDAGVLLGVVRFQEQPVT